MTSKTARDLIHELYAEQCRCDRPKERGETFCKRCYFNLPKPMRQALYRRVGEGYEAAYAAAVKHIQGGGENG